MPAATSKSGLISVCETEFAKLQALLSKIPPDLAAQPDEDGISIRDVVAHRAHWIDLFLGWYADGQAGREVHIPAKGYKWSDLNTYNAEVRKRHAGMTWAEAQAALVSAHERLLWFLAKRSNAALYDGPLKGASNGWTTGRWAESAGASHYRSACKFVRARMRAFFD